MAWSNVGKINLVIGANDSGKTFLLKALYSAVRTLEEYRRGNERRSAAEILAEKLYWTFQPDKIGDLVAKGADGPILFSITLNEKIFRYGFGRDTTKQISSIENHVPPRNINSVFLPAKEVLSLHRVILKSREQDQAFGFDDTYLDLARALRQLPRGGENHTAFSKARQSLETIVGGKVEYDEKAERWQFKKGNQKFPIGVTAEGVKKIAILDTLLGNRYLDTNSIVFIDEPESALHPAAISQLLDVVATLAEQGMQFFLSSHSYFVVKKLFLIAQQKNMSIPIISANDSEWQWDDLKHQMPDNPIINESIALYKQEVGMALQ
jgi:AAA15 family ATPase/GTPase